MKRALSTLIYLYLGLMCISAQTRIQSAIGNTGTNAVTTFNVTLGTAPINGNTLIAIISTQSTATNTITSITQTGATWTRAISSTGNATNATTTEIWYTTALSGGATTLTINQSTSRSAAVIIEYEGLLYGAPLDVAASNFNATTSTTASTGTTATYNYPNALLIGGIGLKSSSYTLSAITNTFTAVANASSTNSTTTRNAKIYALEKIVSTTGTATTGGTVSSKSFWSGAVAVFISAHLGSFTPLSACKGDASVITLNGSGFTSGSTVSFNGVSASTTFVNSGQLTAIVPVTATPGFISVTTAGTTLESNRPFLVKSPPIPTANITKTTCPTSSDGAVAPNNIPIAVNFDYTKSQYINLGTSLLNNLSAFTLEGWIKTTTFNRNSFFGQNNAVEIGLTSAGTVELWSEGLYTNVYSPAAYPTDGLWHHIAGTGDGTTMKIYIDGELIASGTHATLPAIILYGSSPDNTMIGGYVWDAVTPNYHNGQVLKAGFWNRALTNTEIADLASTPHQYYTGESNLIAGYNFFEGTGTTLSKTPSGTNGTFTGTTVSTWTDLFTYSWTKAGGGFSASTKNISALPTGTYNLAATFNGCTSNSGDFVVASNGTESTAATSISGDSPICNGSSSTLTLSGGSLGTAATWKWYSGSCGGTLVGTGASISVSPTTTTTYYVRAEGTCNTTACVSFTVTVNATGQWIGVTSTDWNTASNWCGSIPTSTTDVIIPSGVPYQPTIGDADGVCNSLTINAGATVTISGTNTLTIYGNWINNGTFTANTSTVIFNGTTAISGASTTTFHHLTINSTKSLTASTGNVNITGNWTNNGTFIDNSGTISLSGSSAQTITGVSTFNNLTINNSAGVVAASNLTVNGVLNLASANASTTVGTLDLSPIYSTDVLTSSNNLYMGANATTVGVGDVTGRIIRTTINANIDYSFGNSNTTIQFYDGGTYPTQVTIIPRIGVRHSTKNNTVKRTYQIIRTGGNTPTKFSLKLAYLTDELDGITESSLVYWDHHIPYAGASPHEHGKTELNTSSNYITLSGHGIRYLAQNEYFGELVYQSDVLTPQSQAKIWMISGKESASNFIWLGAANTDWDNVSNWSGSIIPISTSDVIIPNTATRDAVIPDNATRTVKTILIESSRTVTAGDGSTLEVYGSLVDTNGTTPWNNSGTFVPNTGTVSFKRNNSAIAGSTQFYNITTATDSTLNLLAGSSIAISGSFTNNGNLNGNYNGSSSVIYNGSDQTIQAKSSTQYYHLTLSGTGTKTLQSSDLIIKGDLSINASISAGTGTVIMNGNTAQSISGTTSATFNNLSINNTAGVTIGNNETVNGALTLTNGLVTTGSNILTVNCDGGITGQSETSYVNGKLAREYCSAASKIYPIGKGGIYRPLTLEYTTLSGGTSTVLAEQFESEIAGTIPSNTSYQTVRYWNLAETIGDGNGNYTLTLNGSPFTPAATAKILRGNGTTNSLIAASYSSPDSTSTSVTDNTFGNFAVASECEPPTINTHPSATSSCELNGTPQFSVGVTGTYTYQWEVSTTGTGGTFAAITNTGVYSNATTSALTITNPPYNMNGYAYRVVVTRDCGGATTTNSA
ncbi:MAG: beta strand repeat-containing protein, partial [Paludibacter sp.]